MSRFFLLKARQAKSSIFPINYCFDLFSFGFGFGSEFFDAAHINFSMLIMGDSTANVVIIETTMLSKKCIMNA